VGLLALCINLQTNLRKLPDGGPPTVFGDECSPLCEWTAVEGLVVIELAPVEDDDGVRGAVIVMGRPRGVDAEGERAREGVGEMAR
jgi:hypothetical protein